MEENFLKPSEELFKSVTATLEKYKKNKTLVPPEDLAGKYKIPFQKLKQQLADELSDYLTSYSLEGLKLVQDNVGYFDGFIAAVNQIIQRQRIGQRIGRAAFKEFDLVQIEQIAEDLRIRIYNEAWVPFFQKHMCLEVTEECLGDSNPLIPRIYNSLVDKFWDDKTGEWKRDEAPKKPAMFIYIQEEYHEQK